MKKLKTYGITGDGRHRCIVATSSMKAAAEACGLPVHFYRTYGSQTFNTEEIRTAESKPGTPFCKGAQDYSGPFTELEPGQFKPPFKAEKVSDEH